MTSEFILLRNVTIFFATIMLVKYYLFLLVAPFHALKEAWRQERLERSRADNSKPYRPIVSVIVPAWNEAVGIVATVRSILANRYPFIEVLIVNDGSTDNSDQVIRQFLQDQSYHPDHPTAVLRYSYKKNGGKGTALNHGITQAKGDIILTVDADSAIHPEAIERMIPYFEDRSIDAAVGNVKVAQNPTLIGLLQQLEYLFGFYFKRAHSVLNAEYIYGGACAAFRKESTFGTLGLFDELNKTEDIEMSLRTRFNGLNSVYMEDVICYTEGASSIRGLVNQRLRWKKGRFDTLARYRRMFFSLDSKHNRFLCWFILPYTMLSEAQLLFEPLGIALLLTYSMLSADFLSLALGILFIFATYLVNALFNGGQVNVRLFPLFIVTWPLFYFLVWIEWLALVKSIAMIVRGDEIVWQQWDRRGITGATA